MRRIRALILVVLVCLAVPATALADKVGVGVGTGKIEVSEQLKSGGIYTLPPITVFNTGDKTGNYEMALTLNETQDQLKPNPAWVSFEPQQFSLEPGKSQVVTPTLHLPLITQPGDYFGYLEAHPAETAKQGTAEIGVAAATKFSFTVIPSNIFIAILFRLLALYRLYEPWTQIATGLVILAIAYRILRRYVKIKITRA